jgi:hypothetical protein
MRNLHLAQPEALHCLQRHRGAIIALQRPKTRTLASATGVTASPQLYGRGVHFAQDNDALLGAMRYRSTVPQEITPRPSPGPAHSIHFQPAHPRSSIATPPFEIRCQHRYREVAVNPARPSGSGHLTNRKFGEPTRIPHGKAL